MRPPFTSRNPVNRKVLPFTAYLTPSFAFLFLAHFPGVGFGLSRIPSSVPGLGQGKPPGRGPNRGHAMNAVRLAQDLERDEGFVPHAYQDSLGIWTIGIGRLVDRRKRGGITRDEALILLHNDIARHWEELTTDLPWLEDAPEAVQEVLANMAFNMGVPGLLNFTKTLALLQAGNYTAAADEMLQSKWAGQVGARADRLAAMVRNCAKEPV